MQIHNQMTETIAGSVEPEFQRAEVERIGQKRPESMDAYDYLLQGLSYMNKLTPEDTRTGLQYFYKAIEKDRGYAVDTFMSTFEAAFILSKSLGEPAITAQQLRLYKTFVGAVFSSEAGGVKADQGVKLLERGASPRADGLRAPTPRVTALLDSLTLDQYETTERRIQGSRLSKLQLPASRRSIRKACASTGSTRNR